MDFFVQRSGLRDLYGKVAAGERISEADALRLFESKDLNAVGAIADLARDVMLRSLRDDPGFKQLIKEVGFPGP